MRLKYAGVSGVVGLVALGVGLGQATTYGAGPPATPLVEAAKRADAAAVRALLQTGADVNVREVDGTTGLHWAVYHDDPALVDVLVRAGAKADASNRYGVTPLWLATINGNTAIVARLLDAGADARAARADSGETTLMIAARAGHAEVMKVLLDHGANVNAVERHRGQTALMWAAAEKHPAAVALLVEAGADMKARSARAELTPLMFAIRSGDIETTRVLLDLGGDLTETASDGTSLLMLAILNANFELANFLLERGRGSQRQRSARQPAVRADVAPQCHQSELDEHPRPYDLWEHGQLRLWKDPARPRRRYRHPDRCGEGARARGGRGGERSESAA